MTNLKEGDRVMWMYENGGPGQAAESLGTVKYTTARGAAAVQWDCDPLNSPTFYQPAHHDMTRLVVLT